jgi:uncharacterized protein YbjQ (UPF0145 family)
METNKIIGGFMKSKFDITVSTMQPQTNDFEVMGIVHMYHPQMYTKSLFGKDMSHDETFNEILKRIVNDAKNLDANAIYGMRMEMLPGPGAMSSHVMFHVYGTAVKLV